MACFAAQCHEPANNMHCRHGWYLCLRAQRPPSTPGYASCRSAPPWPLVGGESPHAHRMGREPGQATGGPHVGTIARHGRSVNDIAGAAVLLCFCMLAVPMPMVLMSCMCPFSPSVQVHPYVKRHHHELYSFFCRILCSRRSDFFPFPLGFSFSTFSLTPHFPKGLCVWGWGGGYYTFITLFPQFPFPHFPTPYFPQPTIFLN